jgi:hypothetical protein
MLEAPDDVLEVLRLAGDGGCSVARGAGIATK